MINSKNNGITLIALVITIIVLIILAGVAISLTIGENGLLNRTKYAKEEYILAQSREKLELEILNIQTKIMEEESRTATLEDLQNLIDTTKYEIVLYYNSIEADKTTLDKAATYSKVKEISSQITFIVDSRLIITDVEEIDENESTKIQSFEINIENSNGSYFTINASRAITNDESSIRQYKYYINGQKVQETEENKYTAKNLELDTEYVIKVIAVDNEGKEKASKVLKYMTDKVQYLYRNGDTCDTITGGYTTGATTGATLKYNADNIEISSNNYTYVFAVTNNAIDFSKYKKLYVKITTNTKSYSVRLGKNKNDTGETIKYYFEGNQTGNGILETMNIEELNESRYIKLGKHNGENGTVNYYEVWLEK